MIKDRAWAFIIVVLVVSWIVQVIVFGGILPVKYLPLYMYAPALVALVFFLIGKDPKKTQLSLFTRRTTLWQWAFALLYPFFWLSLVTLTALVTGLGKFNPDFFSTLISWPFIAVLVGSVIVSLPNMFGEEYGWRGYLLPTLSQQRSKLWATIITALVWGLWHIPSYYIAYSKAGLGDPALLTMIGVITVAVGAFPYTYLFFLSGNIIPCVLMHTVYDLTVSKVFFGTPAIAGLTEGVPGLLIIPWPHALGLLIVTGTVLAVFFSLRFKKMEENF